jgi:tetratricopeptide (TPR) repeat protein
MKFISKNFRNLFVIILISILFLSILLRTIDYISKKSPTYDEYYYIGYGYSLWKTGEYRLRKDKTTFVPLIVSLPLLFLNLDFSTNDIDWLEGDTRKISSKVPWALSKELYHACMFNLKFLYRNSLPTDKIIFYARLPIVFISLLLGFFVFRWSSELFGKTAGIFSLFLYANCPNILAHSGLTTEDLTLSCFMFLTIYFFWKYFNTLKVKYLLFSGICAGLSFNSKYTAVILFPVLMFISVVVYFSQKSENKVKLHCYIINMFFVFLVAFFILLLFYRFSFINEYFLGMRYAAEYIKRGQMSFLMGKYSSTGFWYYFFFAFLLKTPIPLLFFLTFAFLKTFRNFKKDYVDICFLLSLPILLFITASFSPLQIGHRHILPMYPFLFVFSSQVITSKWKTIVFPFILWYLVLSVKIHPHYLAYFNEFAGGPSNGYKYLVDQNIDWGQDLKGLKEYIKKQHVSDVILSYYGSGLPDYMDFNFQDLFSFGIWDKKQYVNSLYPSKEILAISVTNLQGLYFGKIGHDIFFWLKNKKPLNNIGYSIFIYDVTNDYDVHERLAHIYFITSDYEKAIREAKRGLIINPNSTFLYFLLSLIYSLNKEEVLALEYYKKAKQIINKTELVNSFKGLITNTLSQTVYSNALSSLSYLLIKNEFLAEAEETNYLSLSINPRNVYSYIHLGVIYEKKRAFDKALEFLTQAEQINPSLSEIYYNKAVCYYNKMDYKKSKEYAEKALLLEPSNREAKKLLFLLSGKVE